MKILADENIPFLDESFSDIGVVHTIAGREITSEKLKDVDVLLVRSITLVNKTLLENTEVKFVGSPTIGVDHIDQFYLQENNIGFAYAPGSNATSVAEYVLSALLTFSQRGLFALTEKTVGIIGFGNTGSRLYHFLTRLGVKCLVNDPPLQALGQTSQSFVTQEEIIQQADIISLHVPLERTGDHPTYHMVNEAFLSKLKPSTILINTSRGGVVDNRALLETLKKNRRDVALDVWENEPDINLELFRLVSLATPHIAGYSLDGKYKGIQQIHHAICDFFHLNNTWDIKLSTPDQACIELQNNISMADAVKQVISHVYDVQVDDKALRKIAHMQPELRPGYFDQLRKEYPVRREFPAYQLSGDCDPDIKATLFALGFSESIN